MLTVLIAWALLRAATLSSADGTQIPITLYTDNDCDVPSTTATNISLELGVCAVTPGLASFHLEPFPCASGDVQNYVFADTACGQTDSFSYERTGTDGHCYAAFKGDMAAIMLSCNQETPEQPVATTTIDVGPIATGASPTSTLSSTASSGSGGGSGSSSSSSSSSSTSNDTNSSASGWDSLDLGTRIGIIVSLAVGIPPIILTIYMIAQKRKRKQADEYALSHGTPMQTLPYSPPPYNGGDPGYFDSRPYRPEMGPSRPTPYMSMPLKMAAYQNMNGGGGGATM